MKTLFIDTVDDKHYAFPKYQYARVLPENDPWRLEVKDKAGNIFYFLLGAIIWFGETTERR